MDRSRCRSKRNRWAATMPQSVVYRIEDRSDGRFDVVVTLASGKVFKRSGCVTRAEVDAWIDGLRVLMAAVGAPVSSADDASQEASRLGSQTAHDADQTTS
ncbi:hypothetical protein [Methylobacterium tardum]|uniref:hypothetical protein n=1 Tax=Methylobacterium tardum TaxID=374432 RepID=UPI002020DBAB|nr:hypothetical protein [Methylobacterium tardum]URD36144.1 hypothetical protein M6G65_27695 [Methylobacterium tardum]